MKDVAVVILNYNGEHFLKEFLPTVIAKSQGYRVIVADNASTDDSLGFLEKKFPAIEVIRLNKNKGYSAGYNEALSQIKAKYYVLLNSDVEVTDNWIAPIIHMMEKDPTVAAAQPKILSQKEKHLFEYAGAAGGYIDTLGYPFCRGRIFDHLEEDKGQYNDTKQIFWATGACLFVRADIYKALGGLDDDFFAHMEEIDLCWRINNANYKVMYCGSSTIYHVGGGTLAKSNPKKTYLNFRNGLYMIFKNYSTLELILKAPFRVSLDFIAGIKFLISNSTGDGIAVFKAYRDFLLNFKTNWQKRKASPGLRKSKSHTPIYKGIVIYDYFLKRKKTFGEIDFH